PSRRPWTLCPGRLTLRTQSGCETTGGPVMSGVWVIQVAAPLRLTFWVLAVTGAWVIVLMALVVARHLQWARAARSRERVQGELGHVFSRFLESGDHAQLAGELRPAFMQMDSAERPVAAVLVTDLMRQVSPSQTEELRSTLEQAGIVELGERGTRRVSPGRRAPAGEMVGKIGARPPGPALLPRLADRPAGGGGSAGRGRRPTRGGGG